MKRFTVFLLGFLLCLPCASAIECDSGTQCHASITAVGSSCASPNAVISNLSGNIGSATISLGGTFVSTLQFLQSADNKASWVAISAYPQPTGAPATSATATGTWRVAVGGSTQLCVRASAYTSGSVNVTINQSPASASIGGMGAVGTAGGDLSGTYPDPTVAQVNGAVVPTSADLLGSNASKQLISAASQTCTNQFIRGLAGTGITCATVASTDTTGTFPADISAITATGMSAANFCADAGVNDTYACNLVPAIASYVTGTHYRFKANTANTGAASINFNSKGALTLKKMTVGSLTTDLNDNDIRALQWVEVVYDGTNAIMMSPANNIKSVAEGGTGVSDAVPVRSVTKTLTAAKLKGFNAVLTLTQVTDSGANAIYTGTITNGAVDGDNPEGGQGTGRFTIAGFTDPANNGSFYCATSTATTLTCNNANAVNETTAATATNTSFRVAAAPGAGKYIKPFSAHLRYVYNTTAFTIANPDNFFILAYPGFEATGGWDNAIGAAGIVDQSENILTNGIVFPFAIALAETFWNNADLIMVLNGTTPALTLGNGKVEVYVEYTEPSLP